MSTKKRKLSINSNKSNMPKYFTFNKKNINKLKGKVTLGLSEKNTLNAIEKRMENYNTTTHRLKTQSEKKKQKTAKSSRSCVIS